MTIFDTHAMASVRDLGYCNASTGDFHAILCLECNLMCLKLLEMKRSNTPLLNDTPTFKSMAGVHTSAIKHSVFSVIPELIVEMLLCCTLFVTLCNGLKMSE